MPVNGEKTVSQTVTSADVGQEKESKIWKKAKRITKKEVLLEFKEIHFLEYAVGSLKRARNMLNHAKLGNVNEHLKKAIKNIRRFESVNRKLDRYIEQYSRELVGMQFELQRSQQEKRDKIWIGKMEQTAKTLEAEISKVGKADNIELAMQRLTVAESSLNYLRERAYHMARVSKVLAQTMKRV